MHKLWTTMHFYSAAWNADAV